MPVNAEPPNLRDEMCGPKRKRPAAESDDADGEVAGNGEAGVSLYAGLRGPGTKWSDLIGPVPAVVDAVVVYTGPKRDGGARGCLRADGGTRQAEGRRQGRQAGGEADRSRREASCVNSGGRWEQAGCRVGSRQAREAGRAQGYCFNACRIDACAENNGCGASREAGRNCREAGSAQRLRQSSVAATTACKACSKTAPVSSAAKLDAKNES